MSLWNTTNQSLPSIRDGVQFIVAGHKAWLAGTFEGDCFRSRWASYTMSEVSYWRKLDEDSRPPGPGPAAPDKLYWSERPMRDT